MGGESIRTLTRLINVAATGGFLAPSRHSRTAPRGSTNAVDSAARLFTDSGESAKSLKGHAVRSRLPL